MLAMPEPTLDAPTLGERIRAAYLRAGMNRSQFQRALGVAYTTILHWEANRTAPLMTHLKAIASVTGVSINELSSDDPITETVLETEPAYPALTAFLEGPEGQTATPDELEQLRAVRFRNEPTPLSYHYLLASIRAGIPEAQQAEIAEFNARILAGALAKGGRMLPPKPARKKTLASPFQLCAYALVCNLECHAHNVRQTRAVLCRELTQPRLCFRPQPQQHRSCVSLRIGDIFAGFAWFH